MLWVIERMSIMYTSKIFRTSCHASKTNEKITSFLSNKLYERITLIIIVNLNFYYFVSYNTKL